MESENQIPRREPDSGHPTLKHWWQNEYAYHTFSDKHPDSLQSVEKSPWPEASIRTKPRLKLHWGYWRWTKGVAKAPLETRVNGATRTRPRWLWNRTWFVPWVRLELLPEPQVESNLLRFFFHVRFEHRGCGRDLLPDDSHPSMRVTP